MECYRTAIQRDPNYFRAYYNLGNIYKDKGEYYEAIEQYLKALTINPNYTKCHYNLGLTYL